MTRASRCLASIEALLDTQRQALLAGDLDQLARMPDRLKQALHNLGQHPPTDADLARLAVLATHNTRLIEAAQRGLARTTGTRGGENVSLSTYDALGRQTPAPASGKLLSRR